MLHIQDVWNGVLFGSWQKIQGEPFDVTDFVFGLGTKFCIHRNTGDNEESRHLFIETDLNILLRINFLAIE